MSSSSSSSSPPPPAHKRPRRNPILSRSAKRIALNAAKERVEFKHKNDSFHWDLCHVKFPRDLLGLLLTWLELDWEQLCAFMTNKGVYAQLASMRLCLRREMDLSTIAFIRTSCQFNHIRVTNGTAFTMWVADAAPPFPLLYAHKKVTLTANMHRMFPLPAGVDTFCYWPTKENRPRLTEKEVSGHFRCREEQNPPYKRGRHKFDGDLPGTSGHPVLDAEQLERDRPVLESFNRLTELEIHYMEAMQQRVTLFLDYLLGDIRNWDLHTPRNPNLCTLRVLKLEAIQIYSGYEQWTIPIPPLVETASFSRSLIHNSPTICIYIEKDRTSLKHLFMKVEMEEFTLNLADAVHLEYLCVIHATRCDMRLPSSVKELHLICDRESANTDALVNVRNGMWTVHNFLTEGTNTPLPHLQRLSMPIHFLAQFWKLNRMCMKTHFPSLTYLHLHSYGRRLGSGELSTAYPPLTSLVAHDLPMTLQFILLHSCHPPGHPHPVLTQSEDDIHHVLCGGVLTVLFSYEKAHESPASMTIVLTTSYEKTALLQKVRSGTGVTQTLLMDIREHISFPNTDVAPKPPFFIPTLYLLDRRILPPGQSY